jgi:hypothetical protein
MFLSVKGERCGRMNPRVPGPDSALPIMRCYVALASYAAFLEIATALKKAGVLRGYGLRKVRQFADWANPRLDAWQKRVRPPATTA